MIDPSRKFVCKCGHISTKDQQFLPRIISKLESDRVDICKNCPEYNDYRCKYIELGCRIAFLENIVSTAAKCPLNKW